MCKWTFELAYQVRSDELDLMKYHDLMSRRKVLMLSSSRIGDFNPPASKNICRFLSSSLLPDVVAQSK